MTEENRLRFLHVISILSIFKFDIYIYGYTYINHICMYKQLYTINIFIHIHNYIYVIYVLCIIFFFYNDLQWISMDMCGWFFQIVSIHRSCRPQVIMVGRSCVASGLRWRLGQLGQLDGKKTYESSGYPLVNERSEVENHHFWWVNPQ